MGGIPPGPAHHREGSQMKDPGSALFPSIDSRHGRWRRRATRRGVLSAMLIARCMGPVSAERWQECDRFRVWLQLKKRLPEDQPPRSLTDLDPRGVSKTKGLGLVGDHGPGQRQGSRSACSQRVTRFDESVPLAALMCLIRGAGA